MRFLSQLSGSADDLLGCVCDLGEVTLQMRSCDRRGDAASGAAVRRRPRQTVVCYRDSAGVCWKTPERREAPGRPVSGPSGPQTPERRRRACLRRCLRVGLQQDRTRVLPGSQSSSLQTQTAVRIHSPPSRHAGSHIITVVISFLYPARPMTEGVVPESLADWWQGGGVLRRWGRGQINSK